MRNYVEFVRVAMRVGSVRVRNDGTLLFIIGAETHEWATSC